MRLPHAEEIAALRARVEAGTQAMALNQRVTAALTGISVVEVQHASELPVPAQIPGHELLEPLAALLPQLAEIHKIGENAKEYGTRLAARRQQLMLAAEHLQPMLAELEAAAAELHTLQHEQQHALEEPEWADAVAQLGELAQARQQLSSQMTPLRIQVAHVGPVRGMLHAFQPQLEAELVAAARTEDPHGHIAWRASMIARQQLIALTDVVKTLGLSIGLPVEPMIPDTPHPRHRRRLRTEAGVVLEWMADLSQALDRHGEILEDRLAGLERELSRYESELKELMG
jgi:hypothetical protein